jgi:hypothetical protein
MKRSSVVKEGQTAADLAGSLQWQRVTLHVVCVGIYFEGSLTDAFPHDGLRFHSRQSSHNQTHQSTPWYNQIIITFTLCSVTTTTAKIRLRK